MDNNNFFKFIDNNKHIIIIILSIIVLILSIILVIKRKTENYGSEIRNHTGPFGSVYVGSTGMDGSIIYNQANEECYVRCSSGIRNSVFMSETEKDERIN